MTDDEAIEKLQKAGYTVGHAESFYGHIRVWVYRGNLEAEVEVRQELRDLAEGRLTLEEILAKRQKEA